VGWLKCVPETGISEQCDDIIMTLVSTVLMICFMWCMKGIWIVNSRTVFESFRKCKVCWLSAVIMCLIVSSCCATNMLTATENTGLYFGITGTGSSLWCPSAWNAKTLFHNREI
jgi:hypothetical protein